MAEKPTRKTVVVTEEEAASRIETGMTIAVAGFSVVNHGMPIIRQIIKKGDQTPHSGGRGYRWTRR